MKIKSLLMACVAMAWVPLSAAHAVTLVATAGPDHPLDNPAFAVDVGVGGSPYLNGGLVLDHNVDGIGAWPAGSLTPVYIAGTAGTEFSISLPAFPGGFDMLDHAHFYIGSVDLSNYVNVFDSANNLLAHFTGADFQPPGTTGDQSLGGARNLDFYFGPGEAPVTWTFGSGVNSIEIAGNSTYGVPEPATWAMMILGFGLVGVSLRRRRAATTFA